MKTSLSNQSWNDKNNDTSKNQWQNCWDIVLKIMGQVRRTKKPHPCPSPLHSKLGCLLISTGSSNSITTLHGGQEKLYNLHIGLSCKQKVLSFRLVLQFLSDSAKSLHENRNWYSQQFFAFGFWILMVLSGKITSYGWQQKLIFDFWHNKSATLKEYSEVNWNVKKKNWKCHLVAKKWHSKDH